MPDPTDESRRVRIGLEVRALHHSYRGSGQWRYVHNLLRELANLGTRHEYHLVSPHPREELDLPEFPSGFRCTYAPFAIPSSVKRPWIWEQVFLPRFIRSLKVNLFHFSLQMATWWRPYRLVVTGYDAMREIFPEYASIRRSRNYRLQKRAIRRADRILAISNSSKNDLVRTFGIDPRKMTVVHLAADPVFRPLPNKVTSAAAVAHQGLPPRFILSVLSYEPRKNTVGVIAAFARFVAVTGLPHHLVLFGEGGAGIARRSIEQVIGEAGLSKRVRLVGRIPDDELAALYNLAEFFVFPSLYEGFGLPVLEAMASGRTVIAANRSSMPEILADAGVLTDVANVYQLADAMSSLACDTDLRHGLERKATAQARKFSWERTARRVLEVYESVAAPNTYAGF